MTRPSPVEQTLDSTQFVNTLPRRHPQRSSIQHWQLRDLIACPKTKNDVLYVNQNNVLQYNSATKIATPILKDLSFSPTSMTTGHGFVAAGGQRSQLMVRELATNWFAQTTVGGSINNAMCISTHLGGSPRLLICNNDETIKVYSLPGLQRVASICLPTAVNYCSVSPDGTKMVAVGDSNQVFMYDVGANGYTKTSTLTGSKDAGFSCAWNQSSDKFAVASQDGVVCVWDIRSSEKFAVLNSKQNPQVKGACRCLKFSPTGGIDLMMFSEHVSYINLVDARTFNTVQSVRVSPIGGDQHISGISFSPESKSIFVGLENTILEYDVDTIRRRSFPHGSII